MRFTWTGTPLNGESVSVTWDDGDLTGHEGFVGALPRFEGQPVYIPGHGTYVFTLADAHVAYLGIGELMRELRFENVTATGDEPEPEPGCVDEVRG